MNKKFLNDPINKIVVIISILLSILLLTIIYIKTGTTIKKVLQWPILYYHLPLAINSFFACFLVMICSVMYLKTNNYHWDMKTMSFAEVGMLYCFLVLLTGSIWGKLNWGVFWSWEPRLITTSLLFIMYIVYFMIRKFGGNYEKSSKLSSIVGIMLFVDVPIIYYSIDLWSSEVQLHPTRNISKSDPSITWILPVAIISFSFLFCSLFLYRYFIEKNNQSYLKSNNV